MVDPDCMNRIDNTQIDNAKDIDVVMLMHNLTKYSDCYSKASKVFGNTSEMYQLILMIILLIFLVKVFFLKLNKK